MNNATIKQQSLYTGTLNIQWREGDKSRLSRLALIVQMLGISTIHWMNECSVDTCYVKERIVLSSGERFIWWIAFLLGSENCYTIPG